MYGIAGGIRKCQWLLFFAIVWTSHIAIVNRCEEFTIAHIV